MKKIDASVIVAVSTLVVVGILIINQSISLKNNGSTDASIMIPNGSSIIKTTSVKIGIISYPDFTKLPQLETRIVPDQINVMRPSTTDVTVYMTYNYLPSHGAPLQLDVKMVSDKAYSVLKTLQNLTDDQITSMIIASETSGKLLPGLYNKSQLVSYPNGSVVISANQTKSLVMRITIPANYPDEFLNKSMGLNAVPMILNANPHTVWGTSPEVLVHVYGNQ